MSLDHVQPAEDGTLVIGRTATVELARVVWVGSENPGVEAPAVFLESRLDIVVSVEKKSLLRGC